MQDWMNSLLIPILCGAPVILGVLCLLGWLTSLKSNDFASGRDRTDTIHVDPASEVDLHRLYEATNRMYEDRSGRARHRGVKIIIDGNPSDMGRADEYFRAAARQIEREGGDKFTIEYKE